MDTLQTSASLFNERHSLAIRIWHWTFFLAITAAIVTVLFASTMFAMKDNIPVIQQQVQQKGGVVSIDQAKAVAHEYSDKLWMLHKLIGFVICFLLLCRIIIEASVSKNESLSNKIKKALRFQINSQEQKEDARHYLFVKYGYVVFYFLILIMALTGLGLAFEDVPFLKSIHGPIVTVHSFNQYLIYCYILIHLIGVVRADVRENKGIISGMINGNRS
jgi:Ni,Fe-hydrogenase I cytochrome b subunit